MKLTLEQVCQQLGKSRRQVRYLIDTGRLKAVKDGGRWFIDSGDLPRTPGADQARERRSRQLHGAVDDALAAQTGPAKRRYSVLDIKAFALGLPLRERAAAELGSEHPATVALDRMLRLLAQGCHRFDDADKAAAYRDARDQAALAVCEMLLHDGEAAAELAEAVEQDLMAAFSGLLRRLKRRRRDPVALPV